MQVEQVIAKYCDGVLSGEVPAGLLVRLAVERHLRDLQTCVKRGLLFDVDDAQRWCDFIELLPHVKGEFAGRPMTMEPWQIFIVGSVFGWKRRDGPRRFSTAYTEIPRKNGKTTLAAGVGLGGLVLDDEAGAEVYVAATKRDQAKICWNISRQMVKRSPSLRKRLQTYETASRIVCDATGSIFQPLGKDADTTDGLNPSMVIIDELHAHKSSELYDVIETGEGARRQPLKFIITTAGYNQETICFKVHRDCIGILEGQHADDSIFAFISTLDEPGEWLTDDGARKANPNYGVSVKPDWLHGMVEKARRMPSRQPAVKAKLFDLWVSSAECWIGMEEWDSCDTFVDSDELAGRECWGGLDLASVSDIGSLALVFPDDAGGVDLLVYSWVPREKATVRQHDDRVPYLTWSEDFERTGLKLTDGARTDFATIEADILELGERYNIVNIAADRWNIEYLRQRLESMGVDLVEFGQGFASMSPAIKQLERIVLGRELRHGGNPLLRWAIGNVVAETDNADNVRFNKKKSTEKIDPAVATVMAVGLASIGEPAEDESVYATRGVLTT